MAETLCEDTGRLLQRAAALGVAQVDAAHALVLRAVALIEHVSEDELRGRFLPPLIAAFEALEPDVKGLGAAAVALLNEAAERGSDELKKAITDVFLGLARMMGER